LAHGFYSMTLSLPTHPRNVHYNETFSFFHVIQDVSEKRLGFEGLLHFNKLFEHITTSVSVVTFLWIFMFTEINQDLSHGVSDGHSVYTKLIYFIFYFSDPSGLSKKRNKCYFVIDANDNQRATQKLVVISHRDIFRVYHSGHFRIMCCLITGLLLNLVLSYSFINWILIWKWPKWNHWYDWESTGICIQQMKEACLPLPGVPIPFLFQHLGQR
jgi:hypothetical protein